MNGVHEDMIQGILERLQFLEDQQKIRETIENYSRGLDRADTEIMHSVFWPDARFPDGPPQGTASEFIDELFGNISPKMLASTHHLLGNSTIKIDGDSAWAETYAIAHHRSFPTTESNEAMLGVNLQPELKGRDQTLIIGFRYIDVFERRDGMWRILRRQLIFDWSEHGLYSGIEAGGLYDGTPLRGARRHADPSYDCLNAWRSERARSSS